MFLQVELPAGVTDLDTSLTNVKRKNLFVSVSALGNLWCTYLPHILLKE